MTVRFIKMQCFRKWHNLTQQALFLYLVKLQVDLYESLEGSNKENEKIIINRNYEIKSRNYEIKTRNYEI